MLSPCRRIHAIAEALTSADEDTVVRMIRTAIEGNEVDKFFEAIFIAYGFGYRGALSIELLPLLSCDTTFLMPLLNAALNGTRMCVCARASFVHLVVCACTGAGLGSGTSLIA